LYNNTIQVAPATAIAAGNDPASENRLPLANCVNIAFALKNRLIANPLFKPPSKGLVSIAPVFENAVGNDGTLNDAGLLHFSAIAEDMGKKLPWDYVDVDIPFVNWQVNLGLPDAFIPIRAKTWKFDLPQIIGGLTVMKHIETTDVESTSVRKVLGYRRSRRVEG
jgi:hypothetical protein